MTTRRLAAILAADVVGFSSLMGQDEDGTLVRIKRLRHGVFEPKVAAHHGRIFKTTGDGFLVEFPSPVEAVRCALGVQEALAAEAAQEPSQTLKLRIGINLGDILVEEDGDVYGDGVNVAARLEALCDPGGVLISGKVYDEAQGKVDAAFESRGEQTVKNIAKPVRVYAFGQPKPLTAGAPKALPLPDKPSIAILPFINMSGDPEQEFFADGIVEDITAALSRVRTFFVISRNSTFTYKRRAIHVRQVSRELGVRYVVEGSVRRAGNRVRIAAQLIDAVTGAHLWADHYDGAVDDVFDLQDRIAASVVGAIQPSIRAAEIERAKRKRPESLDAYDLVMRALPHVWAMERNANRTATQLLQEALLLDPTYPTALSLAAWCCGQRVLYQWSEDIALDKRETLRVAQVAASLSSDDAFVLAVLGAALSITLEFERAAAVLDRALALDPNSAFAWARSGWLKSFRADEPEIAIQHFERALRLSPFDPMGFNWLYGIGCSHFVAGRYEQAVAWQEKALFANPAATWMYRGLISAYVFAGHLDQAKAGLRELLQAYPDLTISSVRAALPNEEESTARFLEGLRRAGLPK
jgi:adenylate cyclase